MTVGPGLSSPPTPKSSSPATSPKDPAFAVRVTMFASCRPFAPTENTQISPTLWRGYTSNLTRLLDSELLQAKGLFLLPRLDSNQ